MEWFHRNRQALQHHRADYLAVAVADKRRTPRSGIHIPIVVMNPEKAHSMYCLKTI